MNINFDKVFVVSYINNFNKRNEISQKLNDLNIEFEFMYGPDLFNIKTIKNIEIHGDCNQIKNDYYIHQISCSIGHLNAIEYAYNYGCNNVLIIEDDVLIYNDNKFFLQCLQEYPKDADLIQYGYISLWPSNNTEIFNATNYTVGAQMYALCNRNVMNDYIESQHNIFSNADNIDIFKNNVKNYKIYQVYPQLAIDPFHHRHEITQDNNNIDITKYI